METRVNKMKEIGRGIKTKESSARRLSTGIRDKVKVYEDQIDQCIIFLFR